MSKLAIVAIELLTGGGCDKNGQTDDSATSTIALNRVLEFKAEVYPLSEKACIHHDYTTIRDIT